MSERQIDFVYFDLGKVLLDFSHQRGCAQLAKVAGRPLEQINKFFTPERSLGRLERGQVSVAELYDEFCEQLDCRPDLQQLVHAGCDIFTINMGIVPLVAQLAAAKIRIGILSNTSAPHWQFVSQGRYRILAEYFEVIALSYEIGEMKPHAKIYDTAAQMAGVEPGRIFFNR